MTKKKPQPKKKSSGDVDQKAKHTAALRKLGPAAKRIKTRLEKAAAMDGKAHDHRLAAAIELDAAKKECAKVKLNFQKWCEENIPQSYETVKKLAQVGGADDPAAALEDMRGKNKKRNKELRDRKKEASRDTSPGSGGGGGGSPPPERSTPAGRIMEAFDAIPDDQGVNLVRSQAENYGLKVVSASDTAPSVSKTDVITKAFGLLSKKMKVVLVKQLAKSIGLTVSSPFDDGNPEGAGPV